MPHGVRLVSIRTTTARRRRVKKQDPPLLATKEKLPRPVYGRSFFSFSAHVSSRQTRSHRSSSSSFVVSAAAARKQRSPEQPRAAKLPSACSQTHRGGPSCVVPGYSVALTVYRFKAAALLTVPCTYFYRRTFNSYRFDIFFGSPTAFFKTFARLYFSNTIQLRVCFMITIAKYH